MASCSRCGAKRGHLPGCPVGGSGAKRGRKTPKMCSKTHSPTGTSPHTHVCMENEGHGGRHICGIPTARSDMCGFTW
jgi:hypothetical protein